tara:strand:+ start:265 stop:1386 length:1122 start_codon:yes stop_codon:yes gene_type:complete
MTNKKVLVVLESDEIGGAEVFAYDHVSLLKAKGYNVSILFLFGQPNHFYNNYSFSNIELIYCNIKHRWSIFEVFTKFIFNKKLKYYEIYWSHLYFSILYSRLKKIFNNRIKIISFLHDTLIHRNIRYPLWIKFTDYIYKISFKLDNFIMATSEYCKNEYYTEFNLKNINQYYGHLNMININNALKDFKNKPRKNNKKYSILVPASIKKQKGHILILEAMILLNKKYGINNLELIFVGGISEYKRVLDNFIKKNNLNKSVIFLGALDQKNLYSKILSSNLIILPSFFEPLGTAILQSIALRSNVLISDQTGLFNELKLLGIPSFKNGNFESLADNIFKNIQNKENSKNIDLSYKISKKFSMQSNLYKLERYIND